MSRAATLVPDQLYPFRAESANDRPGTAGRDVVMHSATVKARCVADKRPDQHAQLELNVYQVAGKSRRATERSFSMSLDRAGALALAFAVAPELRALVVALRRGDDGDVLQRALDLANSAGAEAGL